jgi:hypothetical protein
MLARVCGEQIEDDPGYATEQWVQENYQPKGNYLTSIPDEYITEDELTAKGYLTSIPDEYITEDELTSKGYLTSIPDEYITEDELTAKVDKTYLISVFEELKAALEEADIEGAVAILDEAILDLSTLA